MPSSRSSRGRPSPRPAPPWAWPSRARTQGREALAIALIAASGAAAIPASLYADRYLPSIYATYDFWYTSPAYTALKAGVAALALAAAYVFDKVPGPSALRQLGRTSLLVYWVHLEIVYGKWVVPAARGRLAIVDALRGVILLMLAMLALSILRTRLGDWWSARPPRAVATA